MERGSAGARKMSLADPGGDGVRRGLTLWDPTPGLVATPLSLGRYRLLRVPNLFGPTPHAVGLFVSKPSYVSVSPSYVGCRPNSADCGGN